MFVRESQKIPSGYADTNGSCARYSRMPCTLRNCNPGSTLFYTDFNVHTDKSYANTRSISNWVYSEINFLLKRIEESSRPAGPLMEGGWPGGGGRPSQWGRRQKLRPAPCLSFYADDGVIDLCFCVFLLVVPWSVTSLSVRGILSAISFLIVYILLPLESRFILPFLF